MIKKSRKVMIGLLCAVLVTAVIYFIYTLNLQGMFQSTETYWITETYRITAANDSETYLNVCLPVSGGYQEITDLHVEGIEGYHIEYYDGWSEMTAKIPPNNSETNVAISYSVKLSGNTSSWDGTVLTGYTLPQQYVDSDNKDIIRLGEQLRGDNDYQTAENIFKYVDKTIQSPSSGQRVNNEQICASELLNNPIGVCADHAILMTALLRAENIPTRMISGVVLQKPLKKSSDWSHPGDAHAWVEFYVDGAWHFADPTWGRFDKGDTVHLSYGTYEADINSIFQKNRAEAVESADFTIVGWMSTPIMLMVYSTDENAIVVPRVDVSFK